MAAYYFCLPIVMAAGCRLNPRTYDKGPKRCDQSSCTETIEVDIEDSYTAEGSVNSGVKAFEGLLEIGGAAKCSTTSKVSTKKTIESRMVKGERSGKSQCAHNEAPILIGDALATSQNCYDINDDPGVKGNCDIPIGSWLPEFFYSKTFTISILYYHILS
ncbi:hypothetical protein K493DRAFT_299533 [Basidiobolus meristosporus CBS 931.73]|uniref:Uncharacterized protein n=1 Tax=Basidiobolus meristosporus CBS 931.73 TaxID=1314790 RepID=A0A1Y1YNN5_9FUNG|nr:hypothetical protein K493DRAFT_299533 [Basidiobolus meristosporus CBS 931.73]|eukprot:ORX99194.1 hypothetical protein K493DRAFT_299533 [Basidiobolus meristosporus CBS 931.73]